MTQVLVDITGITNGQTLIWDGAKFVPGPHTAAPKVASTLGGLGSGSVDGQSGVIRIGTYPDVHIEHFLWNAAVSKWIGVNEYILLSALDAWAMDFSRQPLSRLRNKWCRPNGGVGWQIRGARGQLTSNITLPQASITILRPPTEHFASVGQILIRDVLVSYTGTTEGDATHTTFTGCTNDSGANGRTFDTDHTPVIPFAALSGGDEGGWGTSSFGLDRVADLWSAGFRLEERLDGFFNGTTDLMSVDFGAFYLPFNLGENLGAASNYPDVNQTADAIAGILGPGISVTGPAYDMAGYTAPGSHLAYQERGFERRTSAWTAWSSVAPTKRFLQPLLYARHNGATKSSGECYSINLMARWVSP